MDYGKTFIATIQAEPGNDLHRLIYADWLEEQGDPRAEYLRLAVSAEERSPEAERLLELSKTIDGKWRKAVGKRVNLWLVWSEQTPRSIQKLLAIKFHRSITFQSLLHAKRAVENCPTLLMANLLREDAEILQRKGEGEFNLGSTTYRNVCRVEIRERES